MADDYDILSMVPETAVVSPTQTLQVTRVGFVTHPSSVVTYVNVPVVTQSPSAVHTTIEQYAQLIELAMTYQGVVGAYFAQDTDRAGLLADYLVVVVQYTSPNVARVGPYQAEVWTLMISYGNPVGYAHSGVKASIDAAYSRLAKTVDG
jgi:hypothetical protein